MSKEITIFCPNCGTKTKHENLAKLQERFETSAKFMWFECECKFFFYTNKTGELDRESVIKTKEQGEQEQAFNLYQIRNMEGTQCDYEQGVMYIRDALKELKKGKCRASCLECGALMGTDTDCCVCCSICNKTTDKELAND